MVTARRRRSSLLRRVCKLSMKLGICSVMTRWATSCTATYACCVLLFFVDGELRKGEVSVGTRYLCDIGERALCFEDGTIDAGVVRIARRVDVTLANL